MLKMPVDAAKSGGGHELKSAAPGRAQNRAWQEEWRPISDSKADLLSGAHDEARRETID